MATLKFNFNLHELVTHSERFTSIEHIKNHSLVVGPIDKEGKYISAGWLKSLCMDDDTLVASAYPACVGDDFECTIYNPRVVDPKSCPRCVLDSNRDSVEYIFGCDNTHAWTSCGRVQVGEVNLLVKAKDV